MCTILFPRRLCLRSPHRNDYNHFIITIRVFLTLDIQRERGGNEKKKRKNKINNSVKKKKKCSARVFPLCNNIVQVSVVYGNFLFFSQRQTHGYNSFRSPSPTRVSVSYVLYIKNIIKKRI